LKITLKVVVGLALLPFSLYFYVLYQDSEIVTLGLLSIALFSLGSYFSLSDSKLVEPFRNMLPFVVIGAGISLAFVALDLQAYITGSYYGSMLAFAASQFTATLFTIAGVHTQVLDNYVLLFPTSGAISVGPSCSGADSSLLFALLSVVMVADFGRSVRKWRLAIALTLGILGVNAANVFRITLLASVFYFSGAREMSLVHQFAGYAIFLAFVTLFWRLSLRWLAVQKGKKYSFLQA